MTTDFLRIDTYINHVLIYIRPSLSTAGYNPTFWKVIRLLCRKGSLLQFLIKRHLVSIGRCLTGPIVMQIYPTISNMFRCPRSIRKSYYRICSGWSLPTGFIAFHENTVDAVIVSNSTNANKKNNRLPP